MTYTDFKNKYLGQGIDFDHYFGNQCMDLYQQYNKEVIVAPSVAANPAYKVWYNNLYPLAFYTKIINTPDAIPQAGDVIIWSPNLNGGFGHIAICNAADLYHFSSLDQNFPSQGYYDGYGNFIGTGVVHLETHNYNYVYGWLRPKQVQVSELEAFKSQIRAILNGAGNDGDKLNRIRNLV